MYGTFGISFIHLTRFMKLLIAFFLVFYRLAPLKVILFKTWSNNKYDTSFNWNL